MRGSAPRWAGIAAVLLLMAVAVAEGAEPTLDVSAPSGPFSVGDRVTVRVSARGADGGLWGDLTVRIGDTSTWAVVDGPRELAGARPPAWEVVLAPLAVGEQVVPEMSTTVRVADGEPETVTLTDPPAVQVASVLPPGDEAAEPAPLDDPIGARGFPWEWVVPGLILALPLAAGAWWLGRRTRARPEAVAARRSPREQLADTLRAVRDTLGHEPPEITCDRLAEAVRTYLERRAGEPAREMTSFELRLLARRRGWPDGLQRDLASVLATVDGVRFGRRAVERSALVAAADAAEAVADTLEGWLRQREQQADDADLHEAAS